MPINGPSSYVPTTNEFLAHWDAANLALGGGGPLLLPGGVTRANLLTQRDGLQTKQAEVEGQINGREIARADLDTKKEDLHLRGGQFNDKVRALLGTTAYARALPVLPQAQEGQGNFIPPLDDISTLWGKLNTAVGIPGFTPPMLLLGGYALADFNTALAGLKAQFSLASTEDVLVTLKLAERNAIQDVIYPLLKSYRQVLPTYFAANSPLVASLPRLTPEPGSTPDPVLANGVWNAPTTQGKLTWDASTDANLAEYEVRWSPGSTYDSGIEIVLGAIAPAAPREFFTAQGLGSAGAVSVFKVYVKTTTGNERGSNTVKITRP
jgi:hypothetical protein